MPPIQPRRLWDESEPDGYLESDFDFVHNNIEAAVYLLEEALRSRSSMTERPPVEGQDAGLVPAVTAIHVCKWIDRDDVTYCECGQSHQN